MLTQLVSTMSIIIIIMSNLKAVMMPTTNNHMINMMKIVNIPRNISNTHTSIINILLKITNNIHQSKTSEADMVKYVPIDNYSLNPYTIRECTILMKIGSKVVDSDKCSLCRISIIWTMQVVVLLAIDQTLKTLEKGPHQGEVSVLSHRLIARMINKLQ